MATPESAGWYWFLPDMHCPRSASSLVRPDRPLVVLVESVGAELIIRFGISLVSVSSLSGDWEPIIAPKRMQRRAERRKAKGIDYVMR